jgi:hypothetical protein
VDVRTDIPTGIYIVVLTLRVRSIAGFEVEHERSRRRHLSTQLPLVSLHQVGRMALHLEQAKE